MQKGHIPAPQKYIFDVPQPSVHVPITVIQRLNGLLDWVLKFGACSNKYSITLVHGILDPQQLTVCEMGCRCRTQTKLAECRNHCTDSCVPKRGSELLATKRPVHDETTHSQDNGKGLVRLQFEESIQNGHGIRNHSTQSIGPQNSATKLQIRTQLSRQILVEWETSLQNCVLCFEIITTNSDGPHSSGAVSKLVHATNSMCRGGKPRWSSHTAATRTWNEPSTIVWYAN